MSVLIKGMNMPKGCCECPLMDGEYGNCKVGATGEYDPYRKDCPLEDLNMLCALADRACPLRGRWKKLSSLCDNCATVGCIFQAGIEREKCAFYKNKDDLFCKSQLITCNRVKECNGVCPFEDALKRTDCGEKAVAEPKTGKWAEIENGEYLCSNCSHITIGYPPSYCPNCGARMNGDEEE